MPKQLKSQEQEYYEDYWQKVDSGKALFEGVPIWGEDNQLGKVMNFLERSLSGKVLDAGCGEGTVALHVSKLKGVSKMIALDISRTAINIGKKKAAKEKLGNIEFVQGSTTNLPFKGRTFDTVISLEVIEHVIDVKRMLSELNRVLKKKGYLAISTVELSFLKRVMIAMLFFENYFDPQTPHIRFFTRKTLQNILHETGFEIVDYKWTNSYFGIIPMGQMVLARKKKDL